MILKITNATFVKGQVKNQFVHRLSIIGVPSGGLLRIKIKTCSKNANHVH